MKFNPSLPNLYPKANFEQLSKFHLGIAPCVSTGREVSFEWSHYRILSTDTSHLTLQTPSSTQAVNLGLNNCQNSDRDVTSPSTHEMTGFEIQTQGT